MYKGAINTFFSIKKSDIFKNKNSLSMLCSNNLFNIFTIDFNKICIKEYDYLIPYKYLIKIEVYLPLKYKKKSVL